MSTATEPNYRPLVERILAEKADEIQMGRLVGKTYGIEVEHEGDCAAFFGGVCRCNCVVHLMEYQAQDPEEN